jgi:hypothetical protein
MLKTSVSSANSDIGEEFEGRVADILRSLGWEVQMTPRSNDYGADLIAKFSQEKLAIQCKCYAGSHVGRAALMEALYGCKYYGANRAFVIFEGRVSNKLKQEAASMEVVLVNVRDLGPDHELDRSEARRKREVIKQHEERHARELEQDRHRALVRQADVELVGRFENHEKLIQEAHEAHRRDLQGSFEGVLSLIAFITIGLFLGGAYLFEQFGYFSDGEESTQFDMFMTAIVVILSLAGVFTLFALWLAFSSVEEPKRPSLFEYEAARNRLGRHCSSNATIADKSLIEPATQHPHYKENNHIKSKGFQCSNCDSRVTVSTRHAKRFRCPKCKSIGSIPTGVFGPY